MKKQFIFCILLVLLIPISYSNGGCMKIADDVFVQLSSSPIVPVANKQTSYLISFGNDDGLINEKINGTVRIMKGQSLILQRNFEVKDGILDLKHTFREAGLYEIFFDFRIGNKKYAPEDFLIEVKEEKNPGFEFNVLFLMAGILIGAALMKFLKK